MHLDTLPPEEASTLLLRISPRIGDRAEEIAQLCGYLPLALELAGRALASRVDLSPDDYIRRFAQTQFRLETLDASLDLTYQLLTPEMQQLWCSLAVFPHTFDVSVVAELSDMELDVARDGLSTLLTYSLIEWNPDTRRYGWHDLARLFADSHLSDVPENNNVSRTSAYRRHAEHYRSVLSNANLLYLNGGDELKLGLDLFDLEWRNIQAGQAWAAANAEGDDAVALLCSSYPNAGPQLLNLRQHPRANIQWLEAALSAARHLSDRGPEGAHLSNLGLAYGNLGAYQQAVGYLEQALAIFRDIGDKRGEGTTLGNLGRVYLALGEPRRASENLDQSLTFSQEFGDRFREGTTLGNLGIVYLVLDETRRASAYLEQALTISREIGDRLGEGTNRRNLGRLYLALGENQKSFEYLEDALMISREIGDKRGQGNALFDISHSHRQLGNHTAAAEFAETALKVYEEIEDPNADLIREMLAQWRRDE